MAHDDDKKHSNQNQNNDKERIEKSERPSELNEQRNSNEWFNKSENWITRPTTSETPTQTPTTQQADSDE